MKFQQSDIIKKVAIYSLAKVDNLVQDLKKKGLFPIDFGVGDPSSPVPDFIQQSACEGITKHETSGYPDHAGSPEFRKSCANYMKKNFGISLNSDTEIFSTIGSKEAIFHFPFGIVNIGDIVIIPTPGYPTMSTGTEYAHAVPYYVGLFEENDFLIDYESIPENITKKAVLMWLNYPNSPTGKTAGLDYYKGLVSWAKKHNIVLAADEGCYIDLYFKNKPHSILEVAKEGIITFYSLSKRNNMTGWRIGFVAGDKDLINIFKKIKINVDSGTPLFIQEAAIKALNDNNHIDQMRHEYLAKKEILLDTLESIGLPKPKVDATFYIWQKAPEGMTGKELFEKLLDEKISVVTTPGEWIANDETVSGRNPGDNYVRFALVPSIKDVKEACRRIKKYF